jgi:hypothetical protein
MLYSFNSQFIYNSCEFERAHVGTVCLAVCICNHFTAPLAIVSVLDSVRMCVPAEHRDLNVLLSTHFLSVLTSLHTVTHRKLPSGMATQHRRKV